MGSFFTSIENFFHAKYHGRYLGIILQEIGKRHPGPLNTFIHKACKIPLRELKSSRLEVEYTFEGERGKRRADLAIFRKDELDPFVLIEIKYNDKLLLETDTKPAQLSDYLAWKNASKEDKRCVLILSREVLAKNGAVSRRWGELAQHLRQHADNSDLIKMLVDFLEDKSIVMKKIDGKQLHNFFKRLLCGYKGNGPIVNSVQAADEFAKLLQNMRNLSMPLETHFKEAWSEASNKASRMPIVDFEITNRLKFDDAKKIFSTDDPKAVEADAKNGGEIYVFARHSLGHDEKSKSQKYLRIRYGIYFEIGSRNAQPKSFISAEADAGWWKPGDDIPFASEEINFNLVTEKAGDSAVSDKIEKILNVLMLDVIGQLSDKKTKTKLSEQQQNAIKRLEKSIKTGAGE